MDKKALRKELLQKRQALAPDERVQLNQRIWQHVIAMPEVQQAQTILLYFDFRGEVDSSGLISWGIEQGKTVCAPITVVEDRRLIPMQVTSLQDIQVGAYNIREPIYAEERVVDVARIDAVILPGVGFDRQGGRLGYGGGYYDRFLPRLREDTVKIAVAYELQILEEVPMEPHDTLLDSVVTEQGVWRNGE